MDEGLNDLQERFMFLERQVEVLDAAVVDLGRRLERMRTEAVETRELMAQLLASARFEDGDGDRDQDQDGDKDEEDRQVPLPP